MFIAKGIKSSVQRGLDDFYKEISKSDFNIRKVSKSAFTQARKKLNPEAFLEMNDSIIETFYEGAPYTVWNQMRVLSVDGTRLLLPKHQSIADEFGVHGFGPNADSNRSMALTSCLYDCINLLTLDAQMAPFATGERELLDRHLEKVTSTDLLLLDRGYPSIALFFLLYSKNANFCVRMKTNWWKEVKEFTNSNETSRTVEFKLPKKDYGKFSQYPDIESKTIKCRLVKITLPNNEVEVLCTSLLDEKKYPNEDLAELYHYRWNEEESYKLLKARIEIENFSGKTAWAVKQDFFAQIFIMSLSASLAFPIEEKVRKEYRKYEKRKHDQKINRTGLISNTKQLCISFFIKGLINESLAALDDIVYNTREIIRPNRSQPRARRTKRPYSMNYKRL